MLLIKQIFAVLSACIITIVSTVIPCSAQTETVNTTVKVPPKIVFLGDSIAAGYGLDGYSNDNLYNCQSYANILGDKYKKELVDVCDAVMINDAVSGDTSEQLLEHIINNEFNDDFTDSDAIVISIGGNDILGLFLSFLQDDLGITQGMTTDEILSKFTDFFSIAKAFNQMSTEMDTAIDDLGANIDNIISEIQSRTDAKIIYQTQYNPLDNFDDIEMLKKFAFEKIGRVNEQISDHSINNDGTQRYILADVFTEFSGKSKELTNINSFDIHPNAEGHRLIANTVDKAIRTQHYNYEREVEVVEESNISQIIIISVIGLFTLSVILIIIKFILKHQKKSERTE